MAITMKSTITFTMSMVVNSETVKDFQEAREEARKILAEAPEKLRGETRYRVELMASDKTDEQCFEVIYRQGIREFIRNDLCKELSGNESRVRTGDVSVSFEKPKGSCQGCVVEGCSRRARLKNEGCVDKQLGFRAPHFEQRFEKTV